MMTRSNNYDSRWHWADQVRSKAQFTFSIPHCHHLITNMPLNLCTAYAHVSLINHRHHPNHYDIGTLPEHHHPDHSHLVPGSVISRQWAGPGGGSANCGDVGGFALADILIEHCKFVIIILLTPSLNTANVSVSFCQCWQWQFALCWVMMSSVNTKTFFFPWALAGGGGVLWKGEEWYSSSMAMMILTLVSVDW